MDSSPPNLSRSNDDRFDRAMMERALALARRGSGVVHPNPMVGAVITRGRRVISQGWHRRAGDSHAEAEAIKLAGSEARGATLYVTMEPCNHHGRTPPCVEAILASGIKRVVFASSDTNPTVKGGGAERLRALGIEVVAGVCEAQAQELNADWFHWIRTGTPLVTLKLAMSLDGKVAYQESTGNIFSDFTKRKPKWISGGIARHQVQRLRRHTDAVMVGSNTVLADNPQLTNRSGSGRQPLRVILDSELKIPTNANVFKPLLMASEGPNPITLVVTTTKSSFQRRRDVELAGAEVLVLEDSAGQVDISAALKVLGERGVQGVLCEGGAGVATTLIKKRLAHRVLLYISPLVIGMAGVPFFDSKDPFQFTESYRLSLVRRVGKDAALLYTLK